MKKWYNGYAPVKEKFGRFPLFWQELKAWPHYKKVKKLYLIATEAGGNERVAAELAKADGADVGVTVSTATADSAANSAAVDTPAGSPAAGAAAAVSASKRRRKSRWGSEKEPKDDGSGKKKRKTRWSSENDKQVVVAGVGTVGLSQGQQQTLLMRVKLQSIDARLLTVAVDAAARSADPNRTPSPEPQYDGQGKRTNTREVRMRKSLTEDRQHMMESLIKLNPMFRPANYV
jgi:splicing factor 1